MTNLTSIVEAYQTSKSYPELVKKLIELGIVSYTVHVNTEITIWRLKDYTTIIKYGNSNLAIANSFTADGIKEALKLNREGKIDYKGFLNHIANAGCQLYEGILVDNRRVEYIGKNGMHTEAIRA